MVTKRSSRIGLTATLTLLVVKGGWAAARGRTGSRGGCRHSRGD